jgi:hypothetical protein
VTVDPVSVDPVSVAVAFAVALALFLLFFLGVTTFNLVVALRQRADRRGPTSRSRSSNATISSPAS